MKEILLVTPVWKDSTRLTLFGADLAQTLAASPLPIHWVISDDGSGAAETGRLQELRDQFATVYPAVSLRLATNHRGKGAAVRNAWNEEPEARWLAFVDADGSLAPAGLLRLIETAMNEDRSVLAIRRRTASTQLEETPFRAVAHHVFLLATRLIIGLRSQDPQCGAKVIRGADYRSVAAPLQENGLAFDSELLLALQERNHDWAEVAVTWREKPGGQVHPLRDAWGMLAALWRIQRRKQAGVFRQPA